MIDPELVTRKMVLITADLRALAPHPLQDYVASPTDEVLVERYLERIIGLMIDINYHLITETGQPPPRDYFDSFTLLAPVGECLGLPSRAPPLAVAISEPETDGHEPSLESAPYPE